MRHKSKPEHTMMNYLKQSKGGQGLPGPKWHHDSLSNCPRFARLDSKSNQLRNSEPLPIWTKNWMPWPGAGNCLGQTQSDKVWHASGMETRPVLLSLAPVPIWFESLFKESRQTRSRAVGPSRGSMSSGQRWITGRHTSNSPAVNACECHVLIS
jgi:hypothetical protein